MKTRLVFTLFALLSVALMGCFEEEDSCNIKTPGIYVEYEVTETRGKVSAQATFWTGSDPGGTYLELGACGDTIRVNDVRLSPSGRNPVRYKATIDAADVYEFVLERPDESPYASIVDDIPPPVEILTPDQDDAFFRDDTIDVTWTNNGEGTIDLLVESDCFWDYPNTLGDRVTDNGSHTIAPDAFDLKSEKENTECVATIELTRRTDGRLSDDLKGTIYGYTTDSAVFSSLPAERE